MRGNGVLKGEENTQTNEKESDNSFMEEKITERSLRVGERKGRNANEIFEENLIFGDAKIGQLMSISMPKDQAKVWFGNPPPDLTLEARLRGADWIYRRSC